MKKLHAGALERDDVPRESWVVSQWSPKPRMLHTTDKFWGFPKIRGTLLGVPIIRINSILGSILGSPYLGKLPFHVNKC